MRDPRLKVYVCMFTIAASQGLETDVRRWPGGRHRSLRRRLGRHARYTVYTRPVRNRPPDDKEERPLEHIDSAMAGKDQ